MVPRTLQIHGNEEVCYIDDNNVVDFDIENDETPENSELFELVPVQASIENVDETVQLDKFVTCNTTNSMVAHKQDINRNRQLTIIVKDRNFWIFCPKVYVKNSINSTYHLIKTLTPCF